MNRFIRWPWLDYRRWRTTARSVPDERGVTHIDALNEAISARRPERFAYFVFDLLHLDGHDLRRCPIEDRKGAVTGCDSRDEG